MLCRQLLIVMDELEVSQSILKRLENPTTKVDCVASLSEALECVIRKTYCLLIIDFHISNIDNTEIVRILRAAKHTPILALTEALASQEKIDLLHMGVDVFLEKPVDAGVCAAQAIALIERYLNVDVTLKALVPIAFGTSLVIAPRYRQALVDGKPIELTRIEYDLLYFMARHPNQVFSREQLYQYVRNDCFDLGGDEAMRSHIKALRRKLAGLEREIIETVWGVGYRFIPPA